MDYTGGLGMYMPGLQETNQQADKWKDRIIWFLAALVIYLLLTRK